MQSKELFLLQSVIFFPACKVHGYVACGPDDLFAVYFKGNKDINTLKAGIYESEGRRGKSTA